MEVISTSPVEVWGLIKGTTDEPDDAKGKISLTYPLTDFYRRYRSAMAIAVGKILAVGKHPHDYPGAIEADHLEDHVVRDLHIEWLRRRAALFVFLSDTYFCANDVVRLLRHDTADIKCGLDFDVIFGPNSIAFYDTWVAHDMNGKHFAKSFPAMTTNLYSNEAAATKRPFQVMVCWNGLTILNASGFLQHRIRFRRSFPNGECHVAETQIISHDFAAAGMWNILVDPSVNVVYGVHTMKVMLDNGFQPHRTDLRSDIPTEIPTLEVRDYTRLPDFVSCIHLDGPGHHPDHSLPSQWNWREYYRQNGHPTASSGSLHVMRCADAFAHSCELIGKRTKSRILD
ncbi:alpha-1,3-mannosyltransferase [Pycnococcus provasolii]